MYVCILLNYVYICTLYTVSVYVSTFEICIFVFKIVPYIGSVHLLLQICVVFECNTFNNLCSWASLKYWRSYSGPENLKKSRQKKGASEVTYTHPTIFANLQGVFRPEL